MDIIIEDRFAEVFDTLPAVKAYDKQMYDVLFDFGTQADCIRFLNNNRSSGGKEYPLVWLETPILAVQTGRNRVEMLTNILIATRTSSQHSNRERIKISFKPTLDPLFENVKKAINRSGFTKFKEPNKFWKRTNYFNYGVPPSGDNSEKESKATDLWDAIRFESKIEMDDCPLLTINY